MTSINIEATHDELLAAIIDSSQDAIISKDLHSRITSWNKAAERLFGYTSDEMIGQLIHRLIPQDRINEEDTIIANLKAGRGVEHFETIRLRRDGTEIRVSLMISPIRNARGEIVGASKIARDITQQRLNEERLQLINEVGKAMSMHLDVDKILQIVTDTTTKISKAAFGAFFYNKSDSNGDAYTLYALSGAPRESFEQLGMPRKTPLFQATFNGTGIVRSDNILLDPVYGRNHPHHGMPEGHLPVVSYLAVPVVSHTGIVIGGLFFGHPKEARFTPEHEELVSAIAAQAAIALDNAKLYEEVKSLSTKKDLFISFASHELKTPISTLKGYLQIVEARKLSMEEFYPKLYKQIARLEEIVEELLEASKLQAGSSEFFFQPVDLSKLVQEACESIEHVERILEVDLPSEEVKFVADEQKLRHVVVNLLTNAVKYSDEGSSLHIKAMVFGDEVQISVRDEGIGIPKELHREIFSQYFRTHHAKHKAKGVGLGLFISKEIIEAHGGRIWFESEVGKGSTFFVAIPVKSQFAKTTVLFEARKTH